MASHNKINKFPKEQRSRKPQQQTSVNYIIFADLVSHFNSDHNLQANFPLELCQECSESLRQKPIHKNRKWGNYYVAAQYITSVTLSMLILLAPVRDVMSQQLLRAPDDGEVLMPLNETSTNFSHSGTLTQTEHISEPMNETLSNTNNKILNSTYYKRFIEEIPGAGVSLNRNSLMRADNVLQRQLREKAKKDSLESIKMHILMRLNLKKLPNITKPITVPQNILENFYKNFNATPLYSAPINHNNNPSSDKPPPRTDLYASDEVQNEPIVNSSVPTLTNEKLFAKMQGDDPNEYDKHLLNHNVPFDEKQNIAKTNNYGFSNLNYDGEYESILSHISSIYIFPEQTHIRHNHKMDVLRFKFDLSYSEISYVTLHLYLRGLDWIRVNQPRIIRQVANYQNKDIIVSVHRAIRRTNSTTYTHKAKMFEFRHKIPSGQGQWVNVDLKPLFVTETTLFKADKSQSQDIFIQGVEPWMQPLVVTSDTNSKKSLTVHIEIGSKKKNRRKRSVFMDCTESDHDMRCCRYPLKVNFTSFGWHFVVAPTSFDAYFCSGDCRVGYLEQYPHTHLAALTTSATPCCSPTKMSSLSLLYFDDNQNLVLSVIPNMSVEGCSCS